MKTIKLILPFFGEFPRYFNFWLESVKFNSTIDFLLVTDNREVVNDYEIPENVIIQFMTLTDLKNRIEDITKQPIKLKSAYKLVDYKPMYGAIFEKEIQDYDFWGFLDADTILGNIRKFLTDELLLSYKKIFTRGHFTLFQNSKEMNSMYKIDHSYSDCFRFEDVMHFHSVCAYDEWGWSYGYGLSEILFRLGYKTFDEIIFADIDPSIFHFNLVGKENTHFDYFEFDNGNLLGKEKSETKEFMYIHLQKREINLLNIGKDKSKFYIYPNCISQIPLSQNECDFEKEFYRIQRSKKKKSRIKKLKSDYLLVRFEMIMRKIKRRIYVSYSNTKL